MVVVLCNSMFDAEDAYDCYIAFLEEYDPWMIAKEYPACNCVLTTEDIYYIFVDYRLQDFPDLRFDPTKNDVVDEGTFFHNLSEQYRDVPIENLIRHF